MNSEFSEVPRLQAALEELSRVIDAELADSAVYFQRGVTHGQLSDPESAVRDFTEAIRLDGSNAAA